MRYRAPAHSSPPADGVVAPLSFTIITIIVVVGTGLFIVALAVGFGVGFGVGGKDNVYYSNKLAVPVVTCDFGSTTCGCAFNKPVSSSRIINGDAAAQNSWPWLAYLTVLNSQRVCTGFLISDRHILTAASCFGSQYAGFNVTVTLGMNTFQSVYGSVNITNATVLPTMGAGDIAVVTLFTNLTFSQTIKPCCITSNLAIPTVNTIGVIAGWGETSANSLGIPTPTLRQAVVEVRNTTACNTQTANDTLCASYDSISACPIDSGGPLMINNNNAWTCVGIITGKYGACQNPISLTRVAAYLSLIRNVTGYPFNV